MTIVLIGLVGGLITGISPCVLPVLPVLFFAGGVQNGIGRRTEPGLSRNARPYLIVAGLTVSFSVFTLLGTLAVSALPVPKDILRWAGLVLLVLVGTAMIFPPVQDVLERPFARLGRSRIRRERGGFVLGLALGAVYVPCAGPVLAAITVAGATGHIGLRTVALTIAFAVGTAVPLLCFALAGRSVAERVRAFRDRQRGVRVVAGLVVIGLAVALTFNVTDALQRHVPDYTASLNNTLDKAGAQKDLAAGPAEPIDACAQQPTAALQNCGKMPAIAGIAGWLNTPAHAALTPQSLNGQVVLVDFWAYSCINCQRAIPHVEGWYTAYQADGLVVIGVHAPEYAFEHVESNIAAGAKRLRITYPIALDNDLATWNNFHNESWPADYLIDSNGIVRHVGIGEGDYAGTETLIRQLLAAARPGTVLPAATDLPDTTPTNQDQTPEIYLGAERAQTNANTDNGTVPTGTHTFSYPASLPSSSFAYSGTWTIAAQPVTAGPGAGIELSYDASDVYLDVGGTGTVTAMVNGKVTTFTIGGAPNIYVVARSPEPTTAQVRLTFTPGLQAYSFTFG